MTFKFAGVQPETTDAGIEQKLQSTLNVVRKRDNGEKTKQMIELHMQSVEDALELVKRRLCYFELPLNDSMWDVYDWYVEQLQLEWLNLMRVHLYGGNHE